MKPPSFLTILVLCSALPSAAQVVAVVTAKAVEPLVAARCDTAFLEKVVNDFKVGGIVADERIGTRSANGVTIPALKFGEPKTCDAGTWRFLASGTPLVWRNADAGKHWDATNAGPNAAVVLVADDFFRSFDPAARKVLAAADAVIEAGVQLGVVTVSDSPKPLSELLKGASGGMFGALRPKMTTLVPAKEAKANLPPDQIGVVLRKLLDENGAAQAGGSAVMDFRLAVLALNAEIGRFGTTASERVALPVLHSYMPGLPPAYFLPKADRATAFDDVKFKSALDALIGAGTVPALDDAAPRAGSLLEPADLGLRNLVAIRAAQVEQIVAAAKPWLKGKTISSIEVAARAEGVAKTAENSLAADVIRQLARTPEYARLDTLYNERAKGNDSWKTDPQALAIDRTRSEMQAAAMTAAIAVDSGGHKDVVYTQGGRTIKLGTLVPEDIEKDAAARSDAAAVIAAFIAEGATKTADYKAVLAAIGGEGQPGQNLTGTLPGPERGAAREVPEAVKKINADGAGCKDPRDLYRNNYESYAARKQAAAAKMTSGNLRSWDQIEALRKTERDASAIKCARLKAEAAATKPDEFLNEASAAAEKARAVAKADKWCVDDLAGIDDRAQKAQDKLKAEVAGTPDPVTGVVSADRNPDKVRAAADAELRNAFEAAVGVTVDALRRDYTDPAGNPRQTKLAADAKLRGVSKRMVAFADLWFREKWPQDPARKTVFMAAASKCAGDLGYTPIKDEDARTSYSNPENPDTVAKKCSIHKDLTDYIVSKIKTVDEQ
jgi:hypothetical protein